MNDKQKNIELIARFMGWKSAEPETFKNYWFMGGDETNPFRYISKREWDPFAVLDHAMVVAQAIAGNHRDCMELFKDHDDDWMCKFGPSTRDWFNHETCLPQPWVGISSHSAAEAITRAAVAHIVLLESKSDLPEAF